MSARVIKCLDPSSVQPLPIPALGDAANGGSNGFVVPPLDLASVRQVAAAAPPAAIMPPSVDPDDVLENARREAARILAEAEESKALIQQAAREQAELDAAASIEEEVAARVADLRAELSATIERLSSVSSEMIGHVESDLVELALQIAKKVVRREVTIDRDIALTLVRVSLGKLHQRTAVEVHLHPEDLAHVNNHLNSLDFRGALNLVEDSSISPGGCLIHTETGDIDARIESQFDEIAFGLLN